MATQTGIGAIGTPAKRKRGTKEPAQVNGIPQIRYNKDLGGDLDFERITAPEVSVPGFEYTNTNINFDDVTPDQLANRFMTEADYRMVDPRQIASEFGDLARQGISKNVDLSTDQADKFLTAELRGLQSFTPAAANLKRAETQADNLINQQMRDAQLASSDPNLRKDLESSAERARAYAEGRVPDSIQNKALELGIQSKAADMAGMGGFGVRSSAAKKASQLMSAERRIGLSQYGDQALRQNIGDRASLLMAPTQYSNAGAGINVMSNVSGAQAALQLAGQANQMTEVTSSEALQNTTQQEQFKSGLEQDTNKFNTGLAAERDLNQAQLNTRAQEFNTTNRIQTQQFGMQLGSQERQFNANLNLNVATGNADRTFQAANINAGRYSETITNNRNTRLQVQQTNKSMVFQDIQLDKQIQGQLSAAGISASASMSNAALSAAVQRESLAANIALQREGMAFQLQQQDAATKLYRETLEYDRNAQVVAKGADMIARAPAIIAGVNSIAQAGSNIYATYNKPASVTPTSIAGVNIPQGNFDTPNFSYGAS